MMKKITIQITVTDEEVERLSKEELAALIELRLEKAIRNIK